MSADKALTTKHSVIQLAAGAVATNALPAGARRVRLDVQATGSVPVEMRFETRTLEDGGNLVLAVGQLFSFFGPCPTTSVSFYNPDAVTAATVAVVETTRKD